MHVFVTGATGFIGKHLVRQLIKDGNTVTGLIHRDTTPDEDVELVNSWGCRIVFGSITDSVDKIAGYMQDADKVVHLAGLYSFWATKDQLYNVNVIGTSNVAAAAAKLKIHMVHISTVATFGKQNGMFTEKSARGESLCKYGATKASGDAAVRILRKDHGLMVTIIFPGPVLGQGDNSSNANYIHAITRRNFPFGTGMLGQTYRHSVQTWVHVHDIVDAILGSAYNDNTIGKEYLVGGNHRTFLELNRMIASIWRNQSFLWRPWLRQAWVITILAHVFEWVARARGKEPWWGLSIDADRVMRHGFTFDGSMAQTQLLGGKSYRDVHSALVAFKDDVCRECDSM